MRTDTSLVSVQNFLLGKISIKTQSIFILYMSILEYSWTKRKKFNIWGKGHSSFQNILPELVTSKLFFILSSKQ